MDLIRAAARFLAFVAVFGAIVCFGGFVMGMFGVVDFETASYCLLMAVIFGGAAAFLRYISALKLITEQLGTPKQ